MGRVVLSGDKQHFKLKCGELGQGMLSFIHMQLFIHVLLRGKNVPIQKGPLEWGTSSCLVGTCPSGPGHQHPAFTSPSVFIGWLRGFHLFWMCRNVVLCGNCTSASRRQGDKWDHMELSRVHTLCLYCHWCLCTPRTLIGVKHVITVISV